MKTFFHALVKKVEVKSLVSLDKGFRVTLDGNDIAMGDLIQAPSDKEVSVSVEWLEPEV